MHALNYFGARVPRVSALLQSPLPLISPRTFESFCLASSLPLCAPHGCTYFTAYHHRHLLHLLFAYVYQSTNVRKAFRKLDTDYSGRLDRKEFRRFLENMNIHTTHGESLCA